MGMESGVPANVAIAIIQAEFAIDSSRFTLDLGRFYHS